MQPVKTKITIWGLCLGTGIGSLVGAWLGNSIPGLEVGLFAGAMIGFISDKAISKKGRRISQ